MHRIEVQQGGHDQAMPLPVVQGRGAEGSEGIQRVEARREPLARSHGKQVFETCHQGEQGGDGEGDADLVGREVEPARSGGLRSSGRAGEERRFSRAYVQGLLEVAPHSAVRERGDQRVRHERVDGERELAFLRQEAGTDSSRHLVMARLEHELQGEATNERATVVLDTVHGDGHGKVDGEESGRKEDEVDQHGVGGGSRVESAREKCRVESRRSNAIRSGSRSSGGRSTVFLREFGHGFGVSRAGSAAPSRSRSHSARPHAPERGENGR